MQVSHNVDVLGSVSFTLRSKAVRALQLAARDVGKCYGMNKKASESLKTALQELALKTFPTPHPIQEEGSVNFDGSMSVINRKIGSCVYDLGILKFSYDNSGNDATLTLYVRESKKGKAIPSKFIIEVGKKGSVDTCSVQMKTLMVDIINAEVGHE